MKGRDGRVYIPFRVRLAVGKLAGQSGYPLGAIQLVERDPLPEHGMPITYWLDAESSGMLASELRNAVHRLRLRTNKKSTSAAVDMATITRPPTEEEQAYLDRAERSSEAYKAQRTDALREIGEIERAAGKDD